MITSCNNFRALFRPGHKYGEQGYVAKKIKQYPDGVSGVYVLNKPLDAKDANDYKQRQLATGEFLVYVGPAASDAGEEFVGLIRNERYKNAPTWDTSFTTWAFREGWVLTRDCSYTPRDPRTIRGFREGEAEELHIPTVVDATIGWTQYHVELTAGEWSTYRDRCSNLPYTIHNTEKGVLLIVLTKNRRAPGVKEVYERNIQIIATLAGQLNHALWIMQDEVGADEIYQQWRGEQKRLFGRDAPENGLEIVKVLMREDKLTIDEALNKIGGVR